MEPRDRLRAALLDFDGTIVSLPVDWDSLRIRLADVFTPYGLTPTLRPLHQGISRSLEELAAHGVPAANRAAVRRRINQLITEAERAAGPHAEPLQGAHEAVELLREAGYLIIIQSSNSTAVIRDVLDRLNFPEVDAIVGRETSRYGKPHPHGVRQALRRFGLQGRECVVIGDGDFDVELGRALGAMTVRIGSSESQAKADHEAQSLGDLPALLGIQQRVSVASV